MEVWGVGYGVRLVVDVGIFDCCCVLGDLLVVVDCEVFFVCGGCYFCGG